MRKNYYYFFILLVLTACHAPAEKQPANTVENLIFITTDGLRWQEVFGGMDSSIAVMSKYNEGDSAYIFNKFWAADAATRRQKLMPFFWSVLQQNGQLFGNRWERSDVTTANGLWFSYPGYNEMLTGYVDTNVNSNDHPMNKNVTVLEFLNQQPAIKGKVLAYGAWEATNRIINDERSGILVGSGWRGFGGDNPSEKEKLLNNMLRDSYRPWGDVGGQDVFTHYGAMVGLEERKPKVLYIAYLETDEWAHAGKYRSYLDATLQFDKYVQSIWEWVQSHPDYKDKTAIVISTDHGRGDKNKEQWTSHGNSVEGADEIWLAAFGAGIPAKGMLTNTPPLYQQQIAQTLANLLGYTYTAAHTPAQAVPLQ